MPPTPASSLTAAAVGKSGDELPDVWTATRAFLKRMEDIRCAASVAMGIAGDLDAGRGG